MGVSTRHSDEEEKKQTWVNSPDSLSEAGGPRTDAVPSADELFIPVLLDTTERKLMARIDWHLMPCLVGLFFLAFLDKVNIANASTLGMLQELNMTGNKYTIAVIIFFIPYTVAEIPANILMKKFKPHVWLSGSMMAFGVCGMCAGLVQNYSGLLAVRFFLGLAETSSFPACFYLISMWYKRTEAQRRFSFFFSSASLAGAFGGLLAAAIGKMNGVGGYAGWRWIFILEGLLTVVVGLTYYFILTDFPEEAKWLNENERAFVKARLYVDQGSSAADRKITLKDVFNVFKDIKIWVAGLMYFCMTWQLQAPWIQRADYNFSTDHSSLRVRLLRSDHHQELQPLAYPDTIVLCSSVGMRVCLRHYPCFLFRSI
ncbi:hypothetical protein FH972_025942 [Carpinus fangiana]|uniref:Major facilitator superfamily (MFS) profile domain-containing protein n=1 Tax=Carpinus fangiana TaxID=176857 RepID=A0A5N6L2Q8_9ROSI|nr:hypothetical protein FH972_025942 [Carpinus fangiana]